MMRFKKHFFAVIGCVFIFLMSGCSRPVTTAAASYHKIPSGYSCFVANHKRGGYRGSAWARHLVSARQRALKRCRVNSLTPKACNILSCRWVASALISENGYFTCYAKNSARYGMWFSTSHNEYEARGRAMYRCQRYSGQASHCYFDYCWLW